jgi:hypothetical protein
MISSSPSARTYAVSVDKKNVVAALDFRNCGLPYVQQSRQLLLRDAEVAPQFGKCQLGDHLVCSRASLRLPGRRHLAR